MTTYDRWDLQDEFGDDLDDIALALRMARGHELPSDSVCPVPGDLADFPEGASPEAVYERAVFAGLTPKWAKAIAGINDDADALAAPSTPGDGQAESIAESARREHVPDAPVTTSCPTCGRTVGWRPDPRRKPYGDYLAAGHCQDCGYVWGDQTPAPPSPGTGEGEAP